MKDSTTLALREAVDEFWSRVEKQDGPDGHWIWIAATAEIYGRFKFRSLNILAHLYAWQLDKGPIPEGRALRKLCTVNFCVRPSHWGLDPAPLHAARRRKNAGRPRSKLDNDADATVPKIVHAQELDAQLMQRLATHDQSLATAVERVVGALSSLETVVSQLSGAASRRDEVILGMLDRVDRQVRSLALAPVPIPIAPPGPAPPPAAESPKELPPEIVAAPPPDPEPIPLAALPVAPAPSAPVLAPKPPATLAEALVRAFERLGGIVAEPQGDGQRLTAIFDFVVREANPPSPLAWMKDAMLAFDAVQEPHARTVSDFFAFVRERVGGTASYHGNDS